MAGNEGVLNEMAYRHGGYEKQVPRISKPDMFMNAALWMEIEGPPEKETAKGKPVREEQGSQPQSKEEKKYHKAGAVFVLPNDRALSVDCTERGVHAAVSALNKFGQERVKNCQVYLSRRPCSFCAKLLVQCEVSKVYYLPIEPELNDADDVIRVDKLFSASSTGLSVYIPKVSDTILRGLNRRMSPFLTNPRNEEEIMKYKEELIMEYWNKEWIKTASEKLKWSAFEDPNMKKQTTEDMKNLLEWVARATKGEVPDVIYFEEIDPQSNPLKGKKPKSEASSGEGSTQNEPGEQSEPASLSDPDLQSHVSRQAENSSTVSDQSWQERVPKQAENIPTASDPGWQKHALHMIRMAQMLSQRSDDPTGPVGCVLMIHDEVVALGWNGFPAKALYGEFPRASGVDKSKEKKEPYVIHAEHNALLTRNKRNLNHKTSVLFSNKIPCGECVPMLVQAGVQNVVVPQESKRDVEENEAFTDAIKNGLFRGFWPRLPDIE